MFLLSGLLVRLTVFMFHVQGGTGTDAQDGTGTDAAAAVDAPEAKLGDAEVQTPSGSLSSPTLCRGCQPKTQQPKAAPAGVFEAEIRETLLQSQN